MRSYLAPPNKHHSAVTCRHASQHALSQTCPSSSAGAAPIGDRLYTALESSFVFETSGWAAERVERVANRLQQHRPSSERLRVVVLWSEQFTAFTTPGRYIYVSRRLLELCRHDEATAFVIAHEIAHHDLGHLDLLSRWLPRIVGDGTARLLSTLYRCLEGALISSQKESDADRHAINLCLRVGYDAGKCLEIFDVLEKFALDRGDIDAALGLDDLDKRFRNTPHWQRWAKSAWYKIRRGYPSIRARRAQLKRFLAEKVGWKPTSGTRTCPSIPRVREAPCFGAALARDANDVALQARHDVRKYARGREIVYKPAGAQIPLVPRSGRFPDWF